MSTQTPSSDPQMSDVGQLQPRADHRGCWKAFAIGCCVLVVMAAIGGFFVYRGITRFVSSLAEKYTSPTPMKLPSVDVSEAEETAVLQRVGAFTEALKQNHPSPPLVLTSRDVNVLINRHPDWKVMAGRVYVIIEGDRIKGDIAFPLAGLGDSFKGRYLNGSAVFHVDMAAGRLLLFLDSVELAGKPLPEEFMNAMRAKNLAEDANKRPNVRAVLRKLESITVRDGTLAIVPKSPLRKPGDQEAAD